MQINNVYVPDRVELSQQSVMDSTFTIKDNTSYVCRDVYDASTIRDYFRFLFDILDLKDIPSIDIYKIYTPEQIAGIKRGMRLKELLNNI